MPISRIYTAASASRKKQPLSYSKGESNTGPSFAYGKFNFDYSINFQGLKLGFEDKNGMYNYKRDIVGWKHESNIATQTETFYLQPIEPLNLPDNVTDFIEIEFKEITIEPDGKAVVFLTIPIEIGVFLEAKNGDRNLLDIVTFCHPKFSLYGAASRGVITRFHKSEVYAMPPSVDNYKEGLLRLEIENDTDEWATIGRVVIYQKGLVLYYDETTVCACAKMIIRSSDVADVVGISQPFREGMTESIQVFEFRKTTPFCNIEGALLDSTFTMDMGMR
ncbi:MAG TPA: DUF432 domain-containing protein [Methanocorpusculum sp.]|nr:DUF432 domain-containing protein [Methanocorpusculum sp.]